jgi:hypothetical protein
MSIQSTSILDAIPRLHWLSEHKICKVGLQDTQCAFLRSADATAYSLHPCDQITRTIAHSDQQDASN